MGSFCDGSGDTVFGGGRGTVKDVNISPPYGGL